MRERIHELENSNININIIGGFVEGRAERTVRSTIGATFVGVAWLAALVTACDAGGIAQRWFAKDSLGVFSVRTTVMPGIPDVSHIPPGLTVAEPAIIADPANPDHVAVAAMVEHRTARDSAGRYEQNHRAHASTRVWWSTDAGASWSEGQDLLPDFSGLAADLKGMSGQELSDGDGTMAGLPDGRFSIAVVVTDWFDTTGTSAPNTGEGPYEGLFVATQGAPGSSFSQGVRMDLSDIPKPSYTYPHVPTLFADRWDTSPRRGSLYLTYMGQMGTRDAVQRAMFLKVSTDGGKSFSRAKELPNTRGWLPNNDAAIAPDGALHLLSNRDSTKVFHAISRDGGETFSEPTPIRTRPNATDHWPYIRIGERGKNRGAILATLQQSWGTREERHTDVIVSVTTSGETLAPFTRLDSSLAEGHELRLPAPAVSENAFWVLAYRDNAKGAEVVLYRSIDDGASWHESRVLAARNTKDFYPGHFVSLSAAGNRLYAAYALPADDDKRPIGLYVSVIEVR